ncbi:hypothetical protein LPJ66_003712 [Kickxella alabastrina]|uniref:Uncharacterized protein n=1 Tax=Kickxella alabastrina TaxID=61397 RepID=A0ACC1IMN2_9FUNG|nr:hypothetical protein LPJ66_003712 [Kickxella alabastrina]
MGIPMLISSPIRGILDNLESVLYVIMDAVRLASTERDDIQGFKFLNSPSLAITRWALIQGGGILLKGFSVDGISLSLKKLIRVMCQFLFELENKIMNHRLWSNSRFVRRANWDAAPEFMHPKAIELLKEDNGYQLKRLAEDEVNSDWYYLAIGIEAARSMYQISATHTDKRSDGNTPSMPGPILPKGSADNKAVLDIQTPEMVNSLAQLALHLDTFKLQDIASELVLDMAMRREMLQLIVVQAQGSSAAEGAG